MPRFIVRLAQWVIKRWCPSVLEVSVVPYNGAVWIGGTPCDMVRSFNHAQTIPGHGVIHVCWQAVSAEMPD